jgi:hypothetical protein
MNRTCFNSFLVAFALIGAWGAGSPNCFADDQSVSCSNDCSTGGSCCSNCCICRCCNCCCTICDGVCNYRPIDGCTKCAWSRTWHGPNALATPLRQYYIPRPPQCCSCYDCDRRMANPDSPSWGMPGDTNCQNSTTVASCQVSPEAMAGFSPVQSERLGRVRNELDVVAPIGAPGASRAAAPSR